MKLLFIFLLLSLPVSAQTYESIITTYADSTVYKVVIRTEEKVDDRFVALDNMTARVTEDTAKVYYMNYGDGLVSSIMIPYSVYDDFLKFEQKVISKACEKPECSYSVLFEVGDQQLRVPIDILYVESLSSFMLELEE